MHPKQHQTLNHETFPQTPKTETHYQPAMASLFPTIYMARRANKILNLVSQNRLSDVSGSVSGGAEDRV
jgi:hypothetical protein